MTTSGSWSPSAGMASGLDRGMWALLELWAGSPWGQWGLHPSSLRTHSGDFWRGNVWGQLPQLVQTSLGSPQH